MSLLLSAAPLANQALGQVAANAMASRLEGGDFPVGTADGARAFRLGVAEAGGEAAYSMGTQHPTGAQFPTGTHSRQTAWRNTKERIANVARGLVLWAVIVLAVAIIAVPGISGLAVKLVAAVALSVGLVGYLFASHFITRSV